MDVPQFVGDVRVQSMATLPLEIFVRLVAAAVYHPTGNLSFQTIQIRIIFHLVLHRRDKCFCFYSPENEHRT